MLLDLWFHHARFIGSALPSGEAPSREEPRRPAPLPYIFEPLPEVAPLAQPVIDAGGTAEPVVAEPSPITAFPALPVFLPAEKGEKNFSPPSIPPIVATHFDIDQIIIGAETAAIRRQRMKNAEALALILAISETLQ